jgi:hypothetical protein
VLRCGAGEHAPHSAHERTVRPQPASLIEELSHLGSHVAEARRGAENNRIGVLQLRRFDHRDMSKGRSRNSRTAPFQDLVGDEFRHLPQADLCARVAGAGGDRLRHPVDMPVHAVKDDLDFCRHVHHPD